MAQAAGSLRPRRGARLRRSLVLVDRFGTQALIEEAQTLDAGFDLAVLAQMIGTLDRFDDDEIPLDQHRRPLARTFFAEWADELRQRQA